MDTLETRNLLQSIADHPRPQILREQITRHEDIYLQDSLFCVESIITLLDRENDILLSLSQEIQPILRDAILNSLPTMIEGSQTTWDIDDDLAKRLIRTSLLLTSPLLDVLRKEDILLVQNSVFRFIADVLDETRSIFPPVVPENFSLLKIIFSSQSTTRKFIDYIPRNTILIMTWALVNDISFLDNFIVKDLSYFLYPTARVARCILEDYLKQNNIESKEFWTVVKDFPFLPVCSLLGAKEF